MQSDCIDILTELESWYARDNGQYLMQVTRDATAEWLDTAFGYHSLQLGVRGESPLSEGSPINHRIYCDGRAGEGVDLVAEPGELPLESDSVDTIIVHHCLEFAANPHQVLREIQRVLTPHGQLLIIGFNPYSLLGCKTRLRGLMRDPLWSQHRPVSEHRLTDWLGLLGCEVLDSCRLYSLPPFGSGKLRHLMTTGDRWAAKHNLPLGGVYVLHAIKKVIGVHPPRRSLMSRRRRLIGLVPKPAAPTPASRTRQPLRRQTDQGNVAA